MKYPVVLLKNASNENYEIIVPDLLGCKSKANSIDAAIEIITQTIGGHLSILAEYGENIPNGSLIDNYINEFTGGVWAIVDIDISPYLGKSHKINVTLPELLIKQIDDRVSKSDLYKTRSGFIASACLNELRK